MLLSYKERTAFKSCHLSFRNEMKIQGQELHVAFSNMVQKPSFSQWHLSQIYKWQ